MNLSLIPIQIMIILQYFLFTMFLEDLKKKNVFVDPNAGVNGYSEFLQIEHNGRL